MSSDALEKLNVDLIPEPQEVTPGEGAYCLGDSTSIALPEGACGEDEFAGQDLAAELKTECGLDARVAAVGDSGSGVIRLTRRESGNLPAEGYRLIVDQSGALIEGNDAAGLFWGTRTLMQAIRQGSAGWEIPCMAVEDWPDTELRSIHYDTKHHQGTHAYVQDLLRSLARYKINALVWEWEDKLAYERHPEVGAPGAFTKDQMRELTAFAAQRHVEVIPLVQGLGHVSYILKHPQHAHVREIADSAWELCPLKEASYELLFDLWDEAMEASPGSRYLHIGSDETYELGKGSACGCRQKAEDIGRDGLMQVFLNRCVAHVEKRGRRAIAWVGGYRAGAAHQPPTQIIPTNYGAAESLDESAEAGYDVLSYSPNPGIEPLFLGNLPWVQSSMWRDEHGRVRKGAFRDTAEACAAAGQSSHAAGKGAGSGPGGSVLGTITTSWDDSGLHTQAWLPRFICAAEYSWSSAGPEVELWIDRYFRQYFGPHARGMRELYQLLQDGALFYYDTFERRVWHWGDIGKIHLPDMPRGELEYHPFWGRRYAQLLHRAELERQRITRALRLIDDNLERPVKAPYDLELCRTVTEVMRHNADLVLMLGGLEDAIRAASEIHFEDRDKALEHLERAVAMVEVHLADRAEVYDALVQTWERTRLPKGLSTPEKAFFHAPDRARHFANRTADMKYLIVDEELLDLEGYLGQLKEYVAGYRASMET